MNRHWRLSTSIPFVVLVVTQLHLLRNASSAYMLLYLGSLFGSIWYLFSNWKRIPSQGKRLIYLVLLIFTLPILSIFPGIVVNKYTGFLDVVTGISRLLFTLPIYLVILAAPNSRHYVVRLIFLAAVITMIAALSIPYQFIFGSISWFAESSERAGLARYASLFGSLTTLGVACGNGLLAAFVSITSVSWMSFVAVCIVAGSLLSLQKAAVANILMAFLFLPFVRKFNSKQLVVFFTLLIIFMSGAWLYFGDEMDIYFSSIRITSESESTNADDLSFTEGIIGRIVGQPSIAIAYHGAENLIFGMGPIGGGGTFGYLDIPMAENGYVDLLQVGGIPSALLFCYFIYKVFKMAINRNVRNEKKFLLYFGVGSFFLLLFNMAFSGLIFFSPSNAMFFALSLKCILLSRTEIAGQYTS